MSEGSCCKREESIEAGECGGCKRSCFPHTDAFVISAQMISIVACLISWMWWTTFVISGLAMILLQILWCCQTSRVLFLASSVVSLIATASSLFSAIWMLVVWKNANWCDPFILYYDPRMDDDYHGYYDYDNCEEGTWAAIAIIDTALWLAVSGCMLYFVYGGRHAEWEKQLEKKNGSNDGSDDNNQGNDETNGSCGNCTDGECKVFCFPYNDAFVITALVVSIVAFLISWLWWVTFFISFTAMILIQITWCCRESRGAFLATSVVSSIAAATCLFSGIWVLVVWKDVRWCIPFIWYLDFFDDDSYDDDSYDAPSYDYCNEGAWAAVAFVDTALWLTVNACMLYFVYSGRHAKWEQVLNKRKSGNNDDNGRDNGSAAAAAATPVEAAAPAMETVSMDEIQLEEETKAVLANSPPDVAVAISTTESA